MEKVEKERRHKRRAYTKGVFIRLREYQMDELQEYAGLFNQSVSSVVREAISEWLMRARADVKNRQVK